MAAEWPGLVASDSRYFEARHYWRRVPSNGRICNHVEKEEVKRPAVELAFANFGRKLSDAEQAF